MYKSILAISEGGPDAAMSFGLAARIASMFGGTVDAVHFSESRVHDVDIAAQAMPFLKAESDARLKARAAESERTFRQLIAPIDGATFTGGLDVTLDQLIKLGRFASLLLIGRPGADAENIAPPGRDRPAGCGAECGRRADRVRRRCLERQRAGRARRGIRAALSREGPHRDDRRRRHEA
jgi:hypothetical protein